MKNSFLIVITVIIFASCRNSNTTGISNDQQGADIDSAVALFVSDYPAGQLADLYKSFYQDAFGPGHILGDTVSARQYLRYELADTSLWEGPVTELTGTGENFIRVNMKLIKDSIVPEDLFFNAFVNSLQRVEMPDSAEWIKRWLKVDSVISAGGYSFPNEETDRQLIDEKLKTGKFTMHHSDRFNSTYNYHYRIISIPVFNETLLPYIQSKQ
ncbi:MAG: hypothetical protein J1E38_09200 [Paramuribaculum sp.]|nr:hypothetical protein [Paramuribaculum sp.]